MSHASVLALTLGDPDGIGPEITGRAWEALRGEGPAFAVVAPKGIDFGVPTKPVDWTSASGAFATALPVMPYEAGETTAASTVRSIEIAVEAALSGASSGVVTNPIAKSRLYAAGFAHPGHTEFLGYLTRDAQQPYPRGPVMMLSGGGLRVALVSIHESLVDAAAKLTFDRILHAARVLHGALITDFGIADPRISMTGLNPHAGENGKLGREELDIINPAAAILRGEGIDITDARPADTLFHAEARQGYDAVLAMYHDQGLIPVKTLDFHGGVNITLGLPIVRTSPDHGTAFDIAGQGLARPDSLIAAIRAAGEISAMRRTRNPEC